MKRLSLSIDRPESVSNCSVPINHCHELIAPPNLLINDLQLILRSRSNESIIRATWSSITGYKPVVSLLPNLFRFRV